MKYFHIVSICVILMFLSCTSSEPVLPQPVSPSPTVTVPIQATPSNDLSENERISPTETGVLNLPTLTPMPTVTVAVQQESIPLPLSEDDPFLKQLEEQDYEIIFSTSHNDPEKFPYTLVALKDSRLAPEFGGETNSQICRLAFYHWNGSENKLMADFSAPTYPENARFRGYPVTCALANWDNNSWFTDVWGPQWPLDEIREVLNLDGYWSDINKNGLPEVGIFYWYCSNACYGYEGAVHFYEFQNEETVEHITSELKGILLPWNILQSTSPLTLKLFDPSLEYEPHRYIDRWWYYAWDGVK